LIREKLLAQGLSEIIERDKTVLVSTQSHGFQLISNCLVDTEEAPPNLIGRSHRFWGNLHITKLHTK